MLQSKFRFCADRAPHRTYTCNSR